MPPTTPSRLVFILLCAASAAGAEPAATPAPQSAAARTVAENVVRELSGELKTQLTQALAHGDTGAAFSACAALAKPITASVAARYPAVVELKRVSLKWRNPANAPDEDERARLRAAAREHAGQGASSALVEERRDGQDLFVYYQPIAVKPLCLQCHGPEEELDPVIRDALSRQYPRDQATGYRAGDFRGLFKVVIRADRLPARTR